MAIVSVVENLLKVLGRKTDGLEDLLEVAKAIGLNDGQLENDLKGVIREKLFMQLMHHVDQSMDYSQRREIVEAQLRGLGPRFSGAAANDFKQLVNEIMNAQMGIVEASRDSKEGCNSIGSAETERLLSLQGYRCRVCGVPLKTKVRQKNPRLPSGIEPIGEISLDHILPFYIGGNNCNKQFLCRDCNSIKNDYLGVQEDGLVLSGNHLRKKKKERVLRRMIFWTLHAGSGCQLSACKNTQCHSLMWADKKDRRKTFAYGNITIYCSEHAENTAVWIHGDSL